MERDATFGEVKTAVAVLAEDVPESRWERIEGLLKRLEYELDDNGDLSKESV